MAALTFADSHNMVAYLEKSKANADFVEIVDFLNASPISYALTVFTTVLNNQIENLAAVFNDEYDTLSHTKKVFTNMRRKGKDFSGTVTPLFPSILALQAVEGEGSGQPTEPQHTPTTASSSHVEPIPTVASSSHPKKTHKCRKIKSTVTEIPQSSEPTNLDADEAVHEERGDSVERATTTAASLDEIGSSGSPRCQEAIGDTIAQTRVLDLENVKDAQALEIKKLKKRVTKLERKNKSRTPQPKKRVYKPRVESSEESLGEKDASKQGRNSDNTKELNAAEDEHMFDLSDLAGTEVVLEEEPIELVEDKGSAEKGVSAAKDKDSTADPVTTAGEIVTTASVNPDDVTLAETLMAIRSSALRPQKLKGVLFKEPSEPITITTSRPQPQISAKDKGKGIMQEPEKPVKVKGKDKIEFDADVAQRLQA
ncbi:hypothetical protein Tco_0144508 [Tanacetum coccineum]